MHSLAIAIGWSDSMAADTPARVGRSHEALLVVDVQHDFCAGGTLAVPGADRAIESTNRWLDEASARGVPVYASRDWHPAVTRHFEAYGGTWPEHCVQGTRGARFHEDLHLPANTIVVSKGEDPDRHGYSAFEGRTPEGISLLDDLRARGIEHLYVAGLATDYCVKHSVLDALAAGLDVTIVDTAIAGVDLSPGDSERALAEMRQRGARFASETAFGG